MPGADQVRAQVRGFIDGTLSPEEHAAFEVRVRDADVARHLLRELHFDQAIRVAARSQDRRSEIESSTTQPPASVRLRRRRARWPALLRPLRWLPAAAAVLACVALGFGLVQALEARTPLAELVVHLGTVTIAGEERRGASTVRRNQPLTVSPRGWASLRFPDGTLVSLDGGSAVLVARDRSGLHLDLTQGSMSADVRRQPAGQPLRIRSPRTAATVVGTRLEFASLPTGDRLAVSEGLVRLARASGEHAIEVPAGNQVAVVGDGPLALERIRAPTPVLPEPPGGGLLVWFDPARGVESDASGRVARWNDQAGKHAVANSEPSQRPRAVNDGRPAIRFAPRAELLSGRIPWPTTNAFTVALAMKPSALGRWSQTIGWGWGSFHFHAQDDGGVYAGVGAPGGGIRFHPGDGPEDIPRGTAVIGRWQRFILTYGHGVGAFYADGRLIARKAMPPPTADVGFSIGRGDVPADEPVGFAGDLGDVLVYDRLLEPAEVATLDRRLQRMPIP